MKTSFALVAVAALASQAAARPEFRDKIPNAKNVKGVDAIGHVDPAGGGTRNKFGLAFAAAGLEWTVELCKADSDGDGQTNGQELGDPCCEWVQTKNPKVQWTTGVSAPGDATSKSDPSLWANVKCGAGAAASNSTGSSNSSATAGSTDKTTTAPAAGSADKTTTAPATTTKAPAATTPAPTKSGAVSVSTGVAAFAIAAVTTAAALL